MVGRGAVMAWWWSLITCGLIAVPLCKGINHRAEAIKQSPPISSPSPPPKLPPCPSSTTTNFNMANFKQHLLAPTKVKITRNEVIGRTFNNWNVEQNCTDNDGTSVEPIQYDHWKLHVIMACTVTAAVEFVLIIFIILYWKQIRWTLRKITCPCDNLNRRHEAMEPEEDNIDTHHINIDVRSGSHHTTSTEHGFSAAHRMRDHLVMDPTVQIFSPPCCSRVESATEGDDMAIPGPSGLATNPQNFSPIGVLKSKYSSSDDSLCDVELQHLPVIQLSPSVKPLHIKNRVKGSKKQKGKLAADVADQTEEVSLHANNMEECIVIEMKPMNDHTGRNIPQSSQSVIQLNHNQNSNTNVLPISASHIVQNEPTVEMFDPQTDCENTPELDQNQHMKLKTIADVHC